MSDLRALIEAVEARTWDGSWRWLIDNIWDINHCQPFSDAYNGSLDAAMALHNALLPGWEYLLSASNAKVFPYNGTAGAAVKYGMADNPARAWLLAILRAKEASHDRT